MSDETLYAMALREYDSGSPDQGVFAKAYVAANGVEEKIKVEYIKLRVTQLKHSDPKSLAAWYGETSANQRIALYAISIALIPLYGLGIIPLFTLLYLQAGENDTRARISTKAEGSNRNRDGA